MKLYRYRPNNSFLFKELKYKEIYLARYWELNDPQDLSCVINYYSTEKEKVNALGNFLHRRMIDAHGIPDFLVLRDSFSPAKLGEFLLEKFKRFDSKILTHVELKSFLFEYYRDNTKDKKFSSLDGPTVEQLFGAIFSTTDLFMKNTSVACFSESNDNFLMWSHYAGGHNGVCLEFETGLFSIDRDKKETRNGIVSTGNSLYKGKPIEFWTEVHKVTYQSSIPTIDFYEMYHALINVGDTDLMNLSKGRWHGYAEYLRLAFLQKLRPWSVENEWRIVDVRFKDSMPEDRIIKYADESLRSICFGANVDTYTQLRIENIVGQDLLYYKSSLNGTDEMDIEEIDIGEIKDRYLSEQNA